jgi:hypothetical protein
VSSSGSVRGRWRGPAIAARDVGSIDAVLLSHDHHADNLDDAGRHSSPWRGPSSHSHRRADSAAMPAASRRGLPPSSTRRPAGAVESAITATPCRQGPPGTHLNGGDRHSASAFEWAGPAPRYLSGIRGRDTVHVARVGGGSSTVARAPTGSDGDPPSGGVRFPITGPLRDTMTATDAVGITRLLRLTPSCRSTTRGGRTFSRIDRRSSVPSPSPSRRSGTVYVDRDWGVARTWACSRRQSLTRARLTHRDG